MEVQRLTDLYQFTPAKLQPDQKEKTKGNIFPSVWAKWIGGAVGCKLTAGPFTPNHPQSRAGCQCQLSERTWTGHPPALLSTGSASRSPAEQKQSLPHVKGALKPTFRTKNFEINISTRDINSHQCDVFLVLLSSGLVDLHPLMPPNLLVWKGLNTLR